MIDESMDKEQMKQEPQPHEFRSKTAWQRLLIMLGGIIVNFVTAFVLYIMILYTWGDKFLPTKNVTYGVYCDSTALSIGMQNGDKILKVDGKEIENFNKITHDVVMDEAKQITVERNGEIVDIQIPKTFIADLIERKLQFISPRIPFEIIEVSDSTVAGKAGLKAGDKIIAFDTIPVHFYDEVKAQLELHKNKQTTLKVLRGNDTLAVYVSIPESGLLGVALNMNMEDYFELKTVEYGFFASFPAGIVKGYESMTSYLKQFKLLFQPETKAYESLGGFISIGNIFPSEWNWQIFWNMTAFLSMILAIMNLLPIPALDGGHVVFVLYEMITRRKPSEKFLEYAQITGMIILFALLIFANGNDVVKLFR
jgi:regulator of sigma E protease